MVALRKPIKSSSSFNLDSTNLDTAVGKSLHRENKHPTGKKEKRPSLVGPQPIVTVTIIDPEQQKHLFRIHQNYICHYSPYFKAAFTGSFAEAETQELQLEEVEGEIFGIFANWLYTQTIENEDAKVPSADQLIRLWVLADRLLVPTLQNQALLVLDKQRQENASGSKGSRPSSSSYNFAYENTKDNSPLRLYITEYCVYRENPIQNPKNYPHQMLIDIINTTRKRYPRRQVWKPSEADLESYMVDVPPTEPRYRGTEDIGHSSR